MANVERKETQIQAQLSGVEQQIGEIEKHILIFLEKLTPILVSPPPTGCEKEKSSPALDAPLAKQLRILRERLEVIADEIKDASSRCEL